MGMILYGQNRGGPPLIGLSPGIFQRLFFIHIILTPLYLRAPLQGLEKFSGITSHNGCPHS